MSGLSKSIFNDNRAVLDYIPILRCMAALDVSDRKNDSSSCPSKGRITRHRVKRSYFESNIFYRDSFSRGGNMKAAVKELSKLVMEIKSTT